MGSRYLFHLRSICIWTLGINWDPKTLNPAAFTSWGGAYNAIGSGGFQEA